MIGIWEDGVYGVYVLMFQRMRDSVSWKHLVIFKECLLKKLKLHQNLAQQGFEYQDEYAFYSKRNRIQLLLTQEKLKYPRLLTLF